MCPVSGFGRGRMSSGGMGVGPVKGKNVEEVHCPITVLVLIDILYERGILNYD